MQEDRIGRSQKGTYKRRHEHEHQKICKTSHSSNFYDCTSGRGATQAFAKENTQKPYKETYGVSHITRHDMLADP